MFDPSPLKAHDAQNAAMPHSQQTNLYKQRNLASITSDTIKGLTVHGKDITGLSPMARRLSLPTLYKGRQTGSPLVPYKLPRLLPHKGRVPGRSQDCPSRAELPTVQQQATGRRGDREKDATPFPGSVRPFLGGGCCGSPMQTCITPVCLCFSCINGA